MASSEVQLACVVVNTYCLFVWNGNVPLIFAIYTRYLCLSWLSVKSWVYCNVDLSTINTGLSYKEDSFETEAQGCLTQVRKSTTITYRAVPPCKGKNATLYYSLFAVMHFCRDIRQEIKGTISASIKLENTGYDCEIKQSCPTTAKCSRN